MTKPGTLALAREDHVTDAVDQSSRTPIAHPARRARGCRCVFPLVCRRYCGGLPALGGKGSLPLHEIQAYLGRVATTDRPDVAVGIDLISHRLIGCGGFRNFDAMRPS